MKTINEQGVTLLELLLVMVIIASLMVFSIRQYLFYRQDIDIQQLHLNVNNLFQALAAYYRANCYGPLNAQGVPQGTLFPSDHTQELPPHPINIQTDLINTGFLEANAIRSNLLVESKQGILNSYKAQFNDKMIDRKECTTLDPSCDALFGHIHLLKMQVAVLLKNPQVAEQYRQILNAQCTSTLQEGNLVAPCASHLSGNYIVWERLPSEATAHSLFNHSIPLIKKFTQMYTNYPLSAISTDEGRNQAWVCSS